MDMDKGCSRNHDKFCFALLLMFYPNETALKRFILSGKMKLHCWIVLCERYANAVQPWNADLPTCPDRNEIADLQRTLFASHQRSGVRHRQWTLHHFTKSSLKHISYYAMVNDFLHRGLLKNYWYNRHFVKKATSFKSTYIVLKCWIISLLPLIITIQ